jgi:hypothetical protein
MECPRFDGGLIADQSFAQIQVPACDERHNSRFFTNAPRKYAGAMRGSRMQYDDFSEYRGVL